MMLKVGKVTLKTPFCAASGCFGYGDEYRWVDLRGLGAVFSKGITLEPRAGNPPYRIAETPCGMLNSIGLENPGIEIFLHQKLPELLSLHIPIFVNIAGDTVEDYIALAQKLLPVKEKIAGIELDLSCPHVEKGLDVGLNPRKIRAVVSTIKQDTDFYVISKLTPNITDILSIAEPALQAGSDALTIANTYRGMAIHPKTRQSRLGKGFGGLSGFAIRPLTLRLVYEVYHAFQPFIFASGGIGSALDAAEYLLAGASAFQIGSALFRDPLIFPKITDEFQAYLSEMGVSNYLSLRGQVVL